MSHLKTFNSKKYSNKSAYSLIELSIVLIIVSLLTVVIISANGLIKNTKLRNVIKEAEQYNLAVNTFYSQFDKLPGDFGTALEGGGSTATVVGGDENGQIEYVEGTGTAGTVEGVSAWQQLSAASIIEDDLVFGVNYDLSVPNGGTTQAAECGIELPDSQITDACWIFDYRDSENVVMIVKGIAGNQTHSTDTAQTVVDGVIYTVLKPSDALSIDVKVDDGVGDTGDIKDVYTSSTNCSSSGVYATGTTTVQCSISFAIDIETEL